MPSNLVKRRDFCLRAGQSASLITLAALGEGCGGQTVSGPSPVVVTPPLAGTPTPPAPAPAPAPTPVPDSPAPLPSAPSFPPASTVSDLPVVVATLSGETVSIPLDPASPLSRVGGAARAQVALGNGTFLQLLVARSETETFFAVNGTCTHEGCIVSRVAFPVFVCPCHGSRYDLAGAVLQGPAPAALPRFRVARTDTVLTIRLSST